jgi:hypothetical protein
MRIGNTELCVRSDRALLHQANPAYDSFHVPKSEKPSAEAQSSIDIELSPDRCSPNDDALLFDAEGHYRVQREGRGYRLSFYREGQRQTHTIVCSDQMTTTAKVYVYQDTELEQVGQIFDPVNYPLDQLLMMYHLAPRRGAIVHAAGVIVEAGAVLLPGASGAGKSTLSRSFIAAGLQESLLSDDRIILRENLLGSADGREDGPRPTVVAWGTPWPGEAMVAKNAHAPLTALLFLTKAAVDEVVPLGPAESMKRLIPTVSCPWYDRERGNQVMETCSEVVERTPCYELRFKPGPEVVDLLTNYPWRPGPV